jgi:hypothetical protein
MNEGMAIEKQRTLMDALERLEQRVKFASEIAGQSRVLVDKFERTENAPKGSEGILTEKKVIVPNIVELFDSLSSKINDSLEVIAMNIERSKNFIG